MTETTTGTGRSAGTSYQELLDGDSRPVREVFRAESRTGLRDGNTRVPAHMYTSRTVHDLEVERLCTLVIRLAPTIILSVFLGYLVWGGHDHFNAFWMSLLAIWIGINIRAFIMGGYRVATKKGPFMFEPADDSPAWGPAGPRSDVDLVIDADIATQQTSGAL